jgi:3-deoxy-D-manno-octulosonic-acid transferase
MKFDGARFDRNNPDTLRFRTLAGISDDDIVFLAGSTQAPEEAFAVECYENLKNNFPQLRLILVPRHVERFEEVAAMLEEKAVLWQRRSKLQDDETDTAYSDMDSNVLEGESSRKAVKPRILLVDTIGELGGWWGTASIAFVGGSLGTRGGQNMIEPAAYGAAVCFGPNTKNFRDIVDLMLRDNAAKVVHDQYEMERFVRRCLEEPGFAEQLGTQAQELVRRQLGAAKRTLEMLETLLQEDID